MTARMPAVANWKQVQARIRKARVGADAAAKLLDLYEKTRDAMVAFELAKVYEKDQRNGEAIEWYTKALERFRREDWKKKAEEAIVRLGGTPPERTAVPVQADSAPGAAGTDDASAPHEADVPLGEVARPSGRPTLVPNAPAGGTPRELPSRLFYHPEGESDQPAVEGGAPLAAGEISAQTPDAGGSARGGNRRRRGRRGGRGRGKSPTGAQHVSGAPTTLPPTPPPVRPAAEHPPQMPETRPPIHAMPPPAAESEVGVLGTATEALRARSGDPALVSRIARMETQLRRLISCPPQVLDEADRAPAGPGVLILSDSDLTTNYYVTACDTLRVEMARLGRTERSSRGAPAGPSLRSRLAEHLGIGESQVHRYLSQHCVVRWLQLDEGSRPLAHFAIGVLHPVLND